jgi:hypothetical protein
MTATLHEILEKRKSHSAALASVDDFRCRRAGTTDAEAVIRNPAITLYCLDERRGRAVFVETPPRVDVTAHPFYYQAQYTHATRLITVSYDTLHALAGAVEAPPADVIVVFSIGRSGSTLVSRVFAAVPDIASLGEPDVYTHICSARDADGSRDAELRTLIHSATRLIGRANGRTLVLKPRSVVVDVADLFAQVYPSAKFIFLHRDLEGWARSMIRAFDTAGCPKFVARMLARQPCVAGYLMASERAYRPRPERLVRRLQDIPAANTLALMWLGLMERYETLSHRGVAMLAVSYETLLRDKADAVRRIFEYCGVATTHVAEACRAFEDDSQRDTPLEKARLTRRGRALPIDRHLRLVKGVMSRCARS